MFEELLEVYKSKATESERALKETQAMMALVLAVENMSEMLSSKQRDVEILGRLIEQVDHLSREVADLKSQIKSRQLRSDQAQTIRDSNALDKHAKALIEILIERPGRYATGELVDMLGLNKTTVINAMKRAEKLDPRRIKLTQGKRRKLFLAYIPESYNDNATQVDADPSNDDRVRQELMALT